LILSHDRVGFNLVDLSDALKAVLPVLSPVIWAVNLRGDNLVFNHCLHILQCFFKVYRTPLNQKFFDQSFHTWFTPSLHLV
jgi:hypothetical protein